MQKNKKKLGRETTIESVSTLLDNSTIMPKCAQDAIAVLKGESVAIKTQDRKEPIEKAVSRREVAHISGLSVKSVDRYCKLHKLERAHRRGYYTAASVKAFLEGRA